jgi:predicted PurR-regulated permease PerM
MSLSPRQQLVWWSIALAVFTLALWLLASALLPFVLGAAIAYFLDPVADRLERAGFSRIWATVTITLAALIVFILLLVLIVPFVVSQIQSFVAAAPGMVDTIKAFLSARFPDLIDAESSIWTNLAAFQETIRERGGQVLGSVLSSSLALVDFAILLVVAPVVAFYLLLDWDHVVARIDHWLPREHAPVIRRLSRDIDRVLAGFVRGQLTVCLILGTFYALGLGLTGLNFGIVIGLFAGLISFIPYVGSVLGGALALGFAVVQFWDQPIWIAAVAAVFVAGQFAEGNFLTPRLVGGSVGLHPVWLMFALSAFGALFGFAGLLVAVPVAAAIGVLSRFALEKYLAGRLYNGSPQE